MRMSSDVEDILTAHGIDYVSEPLQDQMIIYHWDEVYKDAYTRPLKLLFFDIETYTNGNGVFPRPEYNPIVLIAYSVFDDTPENWKNHTVTSLANYITESDTAGPEHAKEDDLIIQDFMSVVRRENPDVVIGYNSWSFDIPYLRSRVLMSKQRWELDRLPAGSKGAKLPFVHPGWLRGRCSYDVYTEVQRDQTIRALPDLKLDTVARHFNIPGKTGFDPGNTSNYIGTPELVQYGEQDVSMLIRIAEGYFRNAKTVCSLASVPLTNYHWGPESWLEKILSARALFKENVIATTPNQSRYPIMLTSDERGEKRKFRAAYVDVFDKGRFE